jgi:hypothetical protein
MRMTTVFSNTINGVGYDLGSKTLIIRFNNGAIYEYTNVHPIIFAELMSADSMSEYLNRKISDNHPARRITKMVPVVSSSINSVGFDPETSNLYVAFNNGSTYEYEGVPPEIFAELVNSMSIGAYLNKNIRNRYPFRRIWVEKFTPLVAKVPIEVGTKLPQIVATTK